MQRSSLAAIILLAACAPPLIPLTPRQAPAPVSVAVAPPPRPTPIPVPLHLEPLTPPSASFISAVQQQLDSLMSQPAFRTATWGALVLGPRGDTIYAHNADRLLIPASNMKIVTAATALAQLGPQYRFRDSATALPLRDTVPSDFGPMYDTLYVRDHTLGEILPHLLKPSQNRLAEELFKTLALERTGSLERDSSIAVISRQLASWNIPDDGYILFDGSGYNREDYLSPQTITQVLLALRSDSAFTVFYNALPIAGIDGTLVHRMRATDARGNVHAKTGSLHAIRSLSGYVTTTGGDELTFSFLCNAFTVMPSVVTGIMDHAVVLLAGLPKLP